MQLILELSALPKSQVLLCHCRHLTLVSHSSLTSFGTTGSSCMGKLLFWISGESACLLTDDTPVWRRTSPAETNLQCFTPQNKGQIQIKFSGCCQRLEKALSFRALVFWISYLQQGPQLHALKWEACENRQDGGDPGTLFLRVPALIDIQDKNKKRVTQIAMNSDLTVSCHVETGRATRVKSFLISGWFMWLYCILALGLSCMQEHSVFPLLWHSRWASHALASSVFAAGCWTQIHQRFEEQTLSSD